MRLYFPKHSIHLIFPARELWNYSKIPYFLESFFRRFFLNFKAFENPNLFIKGLCFKRLNTRINLLLSRSPDIQHGNAREIAQRDDVGESRIKPIDWLMSRENGAVKSHWFLL